MLAHRHLGGWASGGAPLSVHRRLGSRVTVRQQPVLGALAGNCTAEATLFLPLRVVVVKHHRPWPLQRDFKETTYRRNGCQAGISQTSHTCQCPGI